MSSIGDRSGVVFHKTITWRQVADQCITELGFFGSFILAGLCLLGDEEFFKCENPILQRPSMRILFGITEGTRKNFSQILTQVRIERKMALLTLGWMQGVPKFWLSGDFDISVLDNEALASMQM